MTSRKRVASFRANSIEEVVAHACVLALNNQTAQELERCKKRMKEMHASNLEMARYGIQIRQHMEKLHGHKVCWCTSCSQLEKEAFGITCPQCDEWTCEGCLDECDGCHADFCKTCVQTYCNATLCRDRLCADCGVECTECGAGPFCTYHIQDCCGKSAPDEDEEEDEN